MNAPPPARATADLLGYVPQGTGRDARPWSSALRTPLAAAAASRPGSWALARVLPAVDRALGTGTGGRISAPGLLLGLPTVLLRSTGARTGLPRTTPLIPIVVPAGSGGLDGGGSAGVFAVLGTNFGGPHTPGWVYNLLARPDAVLVYRGRQVAVRARLLEGAQRAGVLDAAVRLYAGYGSYLRRAAHREIRLFALDPLPPSRDA